ncbi:MBL fold metallo-hydrolase [Priestia abyssalis]|uniref:MBL fold metallo-hydrolase n=1 Tax=Priestia abyssalis TaxID=1221450 RepID=UPI000995003B|nr:MBL fold metallo-hydrolase [Priestia abyssalis]
MSVMIHKLIIPTPFPVGDLNAYVIEAEKLTLIDAGPKTEEAWQSFNEQLGKLGFQIEDIEQVIVTHHHPDHVGLLDYFSNDMPIIGHAHNNVWLEQDEEFFKRYREFFMELFQRYGIPYTPEVLLKSLTALMEYSCRRSLTQTVKEGDTIAGLEGWTVLETPGHAQGHICLYHEEEEVLMGGDLLLAHVSSNPLLEPPQDPCAERVKSLLQYNHSMTKISELAISTVYAGHGEEVEDVKGLVEHRLKRQAERAYGVLGMLKEKPMTVFEICRRLFPAVYETQLGLTISETIGQLDYLEEAGEIKVDETTPHWLYYAQ